MSWQNFMLDTEKHLAPRSLSEHYMQSWRLRSVKGKQSSLGEVPLCKPKDILCMQRSQVNMEPITTMSKDL